MHNYNSEWREINGKHYCVYCGELMPPIPYFEMGRQHAFYNCQDCEGGKIHFEIEQLKWKIERLQSSEELKVMKRDAKPMLDKLEYEVELRRLKSKYKIDK